MLGPRLIACAEAVLQHPEKDAVAIMGKVDARKLRSSATLFLSAGGGATFRQVLDTFFDGRPSAKTHSVLRGGCSP